MLCFGFDTGSVGSITTMPQFEATFSHLSEIKRGAIVSSMLASSALSGFVAGNVADRISRKYTMASASKSALLRRQLNERAVGAVIFAAGEAICVAAPKLSALIVGRIFAGLGEGFFLFVALTLAVSRINILDTQVDLCYLYD
jgi:MFS family permease